MHFQPRGGAVFGALALLGAVLLVSSRPAHTAGGPIPVNVANTVATRSDDSPARQPFQTEVGFNFQGGFGVAGLIQVPAGKRLVIESMTAVESRSFDKNAYSVLLSDRTGQAGLSLTPTGDPSPVKTQPVRLTAEAGENVSVSVSSSQAASLSDVSVSVSGYYVDVP